MRRFFYDPDLQETGEHILITGPETHHIRTVLRMRPGTPVELFDGIGTVISAEVERISSGRVSFRIVSRRTEADSGVPVTLAQAMLKGKKMDLLIQKATELGVHTFLPIISRYSEKQSAGGPQRKRRHRIMLEACKQCKRPIPMRIQQPIKFSELPLSADSHKIMPWENETHYSFVSADLTDTQRSVLLLVGPEGGFHPAEVASAAEAGFRTISLGPRILRAETAALVAVTLVQHAVHNFDLKA